VGVFYRRTCRQAASGVPVILILVLISVQIPIPIPIPVSATKISLAGVRVGRGGDGDGEEEEEFCLSVFWPKTSEFQGGRQTGPPLTRVDRAGWARLAAANELKRQPGRTQFRVMTGAAASEYGTR
jgi:hypothetical protein